MGIKQTKIEHDKGRITPSVLQKVIQKDNENLSFSFKYLDLNHSEFSPSKCQRGYAAKFLDRLKTINGISLDTFTKQENQSLRSNKIYWENVFPKYKDGFSILNEQLKSYAKLNSWEFAVTVNKHGRVYGFIIESVSTFYLVWIDPEHLLFPRKKTKK